MNKILGLFVVGVCVLVSMQTRASVIATWNFENSTLSTFNTQGGNYSANYTADSVVSPATTSSKVTTITLGANTASQISGVGKGGGHALQFNGVKNKDVNNSSFVLSLATSAALSGTLVITYDYLATSTGTGAANTWTILAGATSSSVTGPSSLTQDGNWHQATVIFSGFSTSASTITFKDLLTGYVNASGNVTPIAEFDNISFNFTPTPVPEPITYAIFLFGVVFVGTGVGRFYLGKTRKTA